MQTIRKQGYARAGLIGNPSDGYQGKTIAFLIRDFCATAVLYEWEEVELLLSQEDHCRFDSIEELAQDVDLYGYYGGIRLLKATVKKFYDYCAARRAEGKNAFRLHDRKFSIRYESNIPRAVGLAGSSAIIVATLQALMEFYGIDIPRRVLPSLALAVEAEELGIAAGLQDRVIQVYGGLVYMDFKPQSTQTIDGFACGTYEPLDPSRLPPMYLAYCEDAGEPTEVAHQPLQARYARREPDVVSAMKRLAEITDEARTAILVGDAERLGNLINANFDIRQSICRIREQHRTMVETARSVGATAKFAGSGGAIVGTYRDEAMLREIEDSLAKLGDITCHTLKPTIATR